MKEKNEPINVRNEPSRKHARKISKIKQKNIIFDAWFDFDSFWVIIYVRVLFLNLYLQKNQKGNHEKENHFAPVYRNMGSCNRSGSEQPAASRQPTHPLASGPAGRRAE
jgi:hypothetical protein